jgi:hypothetical protein
LLWKFALARKEREAAFRDAHPEMSDFLEEMRGQYMELLRQEEETLWEFMLAFRESPERARKAYLI